MPRRYYKPTLQEAWARSPFQDFMEWIERYSDRFTLKPGGQYNFVHKVQKRFCIVEHYDPPSFCFCMGIDEGGYRTECRNDVQISTVYDWCRTGNWRTEVARTLLNMRRYLRKIREPEKNHDK